MHVAHTDTTPRHRAPFPGGPVAAPLVPPGVSDRVAVIRLEIPPGAGLPEHDHGTSQVVLLPVSGAVELTHDGDTHELRAGSTALIDIGERVRLANPGDEPASVLVVASPPDFAAHVVSWPTADGTDQ